MSETENDVTTSSEPQGDTPPEPAASEPHGDAPPQPAGREPIAFTPAPLESRLLAGAIDALIVIVVSVIPAIGGLAAAAYLLIRDGLETNFMDQRSIGKRIMKLRPVRLDGNPMDVTDSIRRNWMFAIYGFVAFLFSTLVGAILAFPFLVLLVAFLGIEIFLVLTDPDRRRFGDRVADTIVIEVGS